jgi:hypothetical protein
VDLAIAVVPLRAKNTTVIIVIANYYKYCYYNKNHIAVELEALILQVWQIPASNVAPDSDTLAGGFTSNF